MPLSAERKIYIPPDNDILSVTPHPLLEQDLSFRGVDGVVLYGGAIKCSWEMEDEAPVKGKETAKK